MTCRILVGDATRAIQSIPDSSVHCIVTSPPYYGLRDYDVAPTEWPQISFQPMAGLPQITIPAMTCCHGMEPDPWSFIGHELHLFRECHRVLRDDGSLWLNIGDSYASKGGQSPQSGALFKGRARQRENVCVSARIRAEGVKEKDLIGIPWMLAFALRADGWYLRQDIIWAKPNPMPESVNDRCTKSHEYVFLLAKSARYYYDGEAIEESSAYPRGPGNVGPNASLPGERDSGENANIRGSLHKIGPRETRNKRSVWTVATQPFKGAHFATFPPALIEPCILAGCPVGGTVLDPFGGSGTTGLVANRLLRDAVLIELNPTYAAMARDRIVADGPLLANVELAA